MQQQSTNHNNITEVPNTIIKHKKENFPSYDPQWFIDGQNFMEFVLRIIRMLKDELFSTLNAIIINKLKNLEISSADTPIKHSWVRIALK